ncbi:putative Actin [Trypanosoma vivax]|uniref:Putative actin n=1 Tax=Trypanosoma vivax (strain Y486) TaxID=1055687 RepID=G0UAT9_TRYVY|nr:putative actin [Trypanosoma vivax]KAH8611703.1 putative Actin [Trypanosoma vivax]CCC52926.1 putative actin [Trypanosoma vivax Y486]
MAIDTSRERVPVVILDAGAHHFRAGYASDGAPRLDIPTLVGQPRNRGVAVAAGMNEYEVGDVALAKRGMLTVNNPIENGLVVSWEHMEKLWGHLMYSELRVIPESHCFIVPQAVNTLASQKEKTLELMMETFHVHSLFLGTSQVLSLYGYGLTTGLVIDSGKDRTLAVPIHEGYPLGRHVAESGVAGDKLTEYFASLLRREGYSFGTPVEMQVLNTAKEELCYVQPPRWKNPHSSVVSGHTDALGDCEYNFCWDNDGSNSPLTSGGGKVDAVEEVFYLPDGHAIPLSDHRHLTTEILFNFGILGDQYIPKSSYMTELGEVFQPSFPMGISWLPFAAINNCQPAMWTQLFANIVLAGGNVSFPGTRERIEAEVTQLYRETHTSEAVTKIRVHDIPCRVYSAWIGGSMLAGTSMFPHLTVSRQEYEEQGHRVVHCK